MLTQNDPHITSATPDDAQDLAKLIDIAGEGIPSWIWRKSCAPAQTPLEIGMQRARRPFGGFSYTNAKLVIDAHSVRAMVLSYAIDVMPEEGDGELPEPIAPFVELERHSVGTWYVNALAAYPGARNQGLGSRLLTETEHDARTNGFGVITIQVFEQNHGALRLYLRHGYEIRDRRPVREHPCQPYYTGDVLLLAKQLTI